MAYHPRQSKGFTLGALEAPLKVQLEKQGIGFDADAVEHFQKDADAISRLHIRGILSSTATDKAWQLLSREITIHLKSHNQIL